MGRCQTLPGACPSEALIRPLMKCNITSDLQQRLSLPPHSWFQAHKDEGLRSHLEKVFLGLMC